MFKLKVFFMIFLGILMALPFVLPLGFCTYKLMLSIWCLPSPIAIVVAIVSVLIPSVCGIRTMLKSKSYQELKNEYIGGK